MATVHLHWSDGSETALTDATPQAQYAPRNAATLDRILMAQRLRYIAKIIDPCTQPAILRLPGEDL